MNNLDKKFTDIDAMKYYLLEIINSLKMNWFYLNKKFDNFVKFNKIFIEEEGISKKIIIFLLF